MCSSDLQHKAVEQYAFKRAMSNPGDVAKMLGIPLPTQEDINTYMAAKEAYVGKSTVDKDVARQEGIRAREEKAANTREKLIWAQMWSKVATTPGSFIVAGMTGVQQAIPHLIANEDKRTDAMNRIDEAIGNIYKADRAERANNFELADKHKEKAIDQ